MTGRRADAYRRTAVTSAAPDRILLDLFERALLECEQARGRIGARDIAGKHAAVQKILDIVSELESSLKHSAAPKIANNLASLYQYIQERCLRASLSLTAEPIAEAERILTILRDAFTQASASAREGSAR